MHKRSINGWNLYKFVDCDLNKTKRNSKLHNPLKKLFTEQSTVAGKLQITFIPSWSQKFTNVITKCPSWSTRWNKVALLLLSWPQQLSQDVPADAGFLRDDAAEGCVRSKMTCCFTPSIRSIVIMPSYFTYAWVFQTQHLPTLRLKLNAHLSSLHACCPSLNVTLYYLNALTIFDGVCKFSSYLLFNFFFFFVFFHCYTVQ